MTKAMPPKGERIEGYVIRNKQGRLWHDGIFETRKQARSYLDGYVDACRQEGNEKLADGVSTHPIKPATAVVYDRSEQTR